MSSNRCSRPRCTAWGWVWPSAGQSWKLTTAAYGSTPVAGMARPSGFRYPQAGPMLDHPVEAPRTDELCRLMERSGRSRPSTVAYGSPSNLEIVRYFGAYRMTIRERWAAARPNVVLTEARVGADPGAWRPIARGLPALSDQSGLPSRSRGCVPPPIVGSEKVR